jgi:hypothetical protein
VRYGTECGAHCRQPHHRLCPPGAGNRHALPGRGADEWADVFWQAGGQQQRYVTLRDVFYIQGRQNPDTAAVTSVLIKRGGEAHAPDRMLINRQQVLLIEPVKTDSHIAKLIAEQNAAIATFAPPGRGIRTTSAPCRT